MIENAAGGFDNTDSNASLGRFGNRFFVLELEGVEGINGMVGTMEEFDGLGEVVVVDVVTGKEVEVLGDVGFGAGVKLVKV